MTTRYTWKLLRAGEFRLDGGSMFGLIPRSVWSRNVPTDDKGRITVQHNCLLLEGGGKRIIIEVGTGDKLDAKSKELFALGDRSILDCLKEEGVDPASVDMVIVSHLHFDHAGGLTRLARKDETPDWTGPAGGMAGPRPDHGVKRTFPNAKVVTQRREWEDAVANRSVMTRTYFSDHLAPIESQLMLIDSPAPFSPGAIVDRDEIPLLTPQQRQTRILPGLFVFRTPGHTFGQQAVLFHDTQGNTVVFTPDVMPTAAHVGAAYSLAYDVEAYTTMVTKAWFLREAAAGNWLLVLDHEPGDPFRRVQPNSKGWYDLLPKEAGS